MFVYDSRMSGGRKRKAEDTTAGTDDGAVSRDAFSSLQVNIEETINKYKHRKASSRDDQRLKESCLARLYEAALNCRQCLDARDDSAANFFFREASKNYTQGSTIASVSFLDERAISSKGNSKSSSRRSP